MMKAPKKRVLLGMSGGLDSTYAARLLLEAGYEVVGAVLVFSEHTETGSARLAAEEVGIALIEIDVTARFDRYVVKNFVSEYANGRTPNPCVVCNRYVKMAALYEAAREGGFDYFATGHYARVVTVDGRYAVAMAKDTTKDQSYMLWGLSQEMLSMLLTPLAEREKDEVKKEALAVSLSAAGKKESQDICFIPDGDYVGFIERYAEKNQLDFVKRAFLAGNFVDREGKVIGKHRGIVHYTVGQRKHLGIALGYPAFVTEIVASTGDVVLSGAENTAKSEITVSSLVFQGLPEQSEGEAKCLVKIRYAARPTPCRAVFEGNRARVIFEEPQRTPAKGQSAVFYQGGAVLFGGTIE